MRYSRGLIVVLFTCMFSSFASAQEASKNWNMTANCTNGRFWKVMPSEAKVVYVLGFSEGMVMALASDACMKSNATQAKSEGGLDQSYAKRMHNLLFHEPTIPANFTRGDVISELDRFYEEAANLPISLCTSYLWVGAKMRGAPPRDLQDVLASLRRVSNEQQNNPSEPKSNEDKTQQ